MKVLLAATIALVACTPQQGEAFQRGIEQGQSAAASAQSRPAASAPTRPTPTPEATIRKKVGAAVEYANGWKITALRWSDQPAGRFSTPKPGNHFVVAIVRYDNGTPTVGHFNPYDWKLQDGAGVRRDISFSSDRDDRLSSGDLAPGGFVSGSLVFEVAAGDTQLVLIYEEGFNYKQAQWELY